MDHSAIQECLCRDYKAHWLIKWKPNSPAASHVGGAYERKMRSVRSILNALLREYGRNLDDGSFRNLLTDFECIINSRPLTVPDDFDLLTPKHLFTMKSKIVMLPPGNFQKPDDYLGKRWRRIQYLSNVFCSRSKKEYVRLLQKRPKWNSAPQKKSRRRRSGPHCGWPFAKKLLEHGVCNRYSARLRRSSPVRLKSPREQRSWIGQLISLCCC